MRVLLVDPVLKSISEAHIEPGLKAYQAAVDGYIEGIYPGRFNAAFISTFGYVNENGLYRPEWKGHPWSVPGYPHLVGPGVFVDDLGNGDETDCSMPLQVLQQLVNWNY